MAKKPGGVGRLVDKFEGKGSSNSSLSINETSGSRDRQQSSNTGSGVNRQSSKKKVFAEASDSDQQAPKSSHKTSLSDLKKQSTSSPSQKQIIKNKEKSQPKESKNLTSFTKEESAGESTKKRSKSTERAKSKRTSSRPKNRDGAKQSRSRSREKDDMGKALKSRSGSKKDIGSKSKDRQNEQLPSKSTSTNGSSRSRSKERNEVGSNKPKRKSTRSRSKDKEKVPASDQNSTRKSRRSGRNNDQEDENAIVEQSEWWAIAKTTERERTNEQRSWYDVGNEKKAPKRTASGESVPGATAVAPPREIRAELENMDYLAQPGLTRHPTYAGSSPAYPGGEESNGRLTPPLLQARHTTSYANTARRPTASDLENLRDFQNQTSGGAESPRLNESGTSLSRFNESATSNRLHDSGISSALSVESWRDDGDDNFDSRYGERVLDRMLEEDSEVTSQDPSFTSAILAQAGTPALARQEARVLGTGAYRMSGAQGQRANMERPVLSSVNGDESQQGRSSLNGLFTWTNSQGRNNSMQHSSNGILVEATLVEDPVMATVVPEGVEPVNQEAQQVSQAREMPVVEGKMFPEPRDSRCMKKFFWCAIISALIVVAATVGGVLFYFFSPTNSGDSDSGSSPNFQQFIATLPTDSQQALEDPTSPQSSAMRWLEEKYTPDAFTNLEFTQKFSLVTFYFSTGGEEWSEDGQWLESDDECQWYSNRDDVCDAESNYTALSFPQNNLVGKLPGEISLLERMRHLNLPSNSIEGEIPSQLGDLNQLVKLDLSANQLTGTLPNALSSLRGSLESLFLDSNPGINGTIPDSWSLLTSLKQLTLQSISISGSVPEGVCTLVRGGLVLTVDCQNVLCGCACVCTKDESGGDSPGLSRLSLLLPNSTLEELSIANTPQARAYSWMGDDPGIDSYDDHRLVQRFALSCFYYSTDQNTWLDDTLWLSNEHECDWYSDASEPCENDALVTLQMSTHSIDGSLPPEIGLLTSLKVILLDDNFLRGTLPTEIGNLKNLTILSLEDNFLNGTLPSELENLNLLEELIVYENFFVEEIPSQLGSLLNLVILDLDRNEFEGPIPPELGDLVNLESLYFRDNYLNGTVPDSFVGHSSIQRIDIADNFLTGQVDSKFWSTWNNCTLVDIGRNQFDDELPTTIGELSVLNHLDVYGNFFHGFIPTQLGDLMNLQYLYLEDNEFEGNLPSQLARIPTLKLIHAHDNLLSGVVPTELCDKVRDEGLELKVDCDFLFCNCGCACSEDDDTGDERRQRKQRKKRL